MGSKIIVTQGLKIYPASGRVFIQNGKMISLSERDQYEYYCWFLSWIVKEETIQTIEPDTFTIYRMELDEEVVNINQPYPIARLIKVNGISYFEYITTLYLKSGKQPNVLRLTCLHREDLSDNLQHLTVSQIRKVIKGIFSLQLNTLSGI